MFTSRAFLDLGLTRRSVNHSMLVLKHGAMNEWVEVLFCFLNMDIQFFHQLLSIRLFFSTEFPLYLYQKSICLYIPVPSPGAGFVLVWFVFPHSLLVFWAVLN